MSLYNTKKACFIRLKGYPYTPIHFDAPICLDAPCMFECHHMFGWPPVCLDAHLYVWTPICLDAHCMVGFPYMFGHPLYVLMPSICLAAPHMFGCHQMFRGIQRYQGHPNILGHPNVCGVYGHPLSLTKHAFFVLYIYSRHPNIFQAYIGASKHMGVSKHMGIS